MDSPALTAGRTLITLSNIFYSGGAFIADWSPTHVLNPRWPPHARFHNGQTMSLGVLLTAASMYFIYRRNDTVAATKDSIRSAAVIGSLYCLAGLSAIWYPGTLWIDPEFGEGHPQLFFFGGQVAATWLGYWLEMRRLAKSKTA